MITDMSYKITYRGWPGHFIMAPRCIFRLNTLVEHKIVTDFCSTKIIRVVVSTVGNLRPRMCGSSIGPVEPTSGLADFPPATYYETKAFEAELVRGIYWDADVTREVRFDGQHSINHIDKTSDDEAQKMHEAAVDAVLKMMAEGKVGNHNNTEEENAG